MSRSIRTIKDNICVSEAGSITYDIHFSNRRTASTQISPDGKVSIRMPLSTTIEQANAIILKRAEWIIKTLKKIATKRGDVPEISYTEGSIHLLMGKEYKLKLIKSTPTRVEIEGDEIVLYSPRIDKAKEILKVWYYNKCLELIVPIFIEITNEFFERHNVMAESLEFKHVKTYWGLCTSKDIVRLNVNLVKTPKECIKYIITHELCHLVHKNHAKEFHDLIMKELPNWHELDQLLKKYEVQAIER